MSSQDMNLPENALLSTAIAKEKKSNILMNNWTSFHTTKWTTLLAYRVFGY